MRRQYVTNILTLALCLLPLVGCSNIDKESYYRGFKTGVKCGQVFNQEECEEIWQENAR